MNPDWQEPEGGDVAGIRMEDYDYPLPEDRIALYPLPVRDQSKLLVFRPGLGKDKAITTSVFRQVTDFLPKPSLLVFNNTKVVRARLVFSKDHPVESPSHTPPARIEIFCLEPTMPVDIAQAFASTGSCRFKCLVGNNKRWKSGSLHMEFPLSGMETGSKSKMDGTTETGFPNEPQAESQAGFRTEAGSVPGKRPGFQGEEPLEGEKGELRASKLRNLEDAFEVEFSWSPQELSFSEVLEQCGKVPLPPYIHRQAENSDKERYQTVFARHDGSVAAPTAGLHFTPAILESLPTLGIDQAFLTLHVGAGTFKPVKSERIGEHAMHREHISVTRGLLEKLLHAVEHGIPVIPVGTTSMRSLESLYWIGVRILSARKDFPAWTEGEFEVGQWDPYGELSHSGISSKESLQAILNWMRKEGQEILQGHTSLMIAPGYHFAFCKGIITNFHQPKSTLLLLVSALIGPAWKEIYDFALKNGFRFLSYGDSCLFLPLAFADVQDSGSRER